MSVDGASWDEGGAGAAEDPHTQHSDEKVDHSAQDSHVSGDTADSASEDGGDYDPESISFDPASPAPEKAVSATPSQPAPPKPKMSGGFIVEASDDEDEDEPAPAVPSQPQNPSTATPVATDSGLPVPPTAPSPGAAPTIATMDPVVLLEARVKEDPRGDMDAWLNLIADHRRRSKLAEVRSVYSKFVEVFPQAVSPHPPSRSYLCGS
jgi:cleavage stimulation factor subunit 3